MTCIRRCVFMPNWLTEGSKLVQHVVMSITILFGSVNGRGCYINPNVALGPWSPGSTGRRVAKSTPIKKAASTHVQSLSPVLPIMVKMEDGIVPALGQLNQRVANESIINLTVERVHRGAGCRQRIIFFLLLFLLPLTFSPMSLTSSLDAGTWSRAEALRELIFGTWMQEGARRNRNIMRDSACTCTFVPVQAASYNAEYI